MKIEQQKEIISGFKHLELLANQVVEGFISGILSLYSGKEYVAVETDCWATGGRVCRFQADVREGDS